MKSRLTIITAVAFSLLTLAMPAPSVAAERVQVEERATAVWGSVDSSGCVHTTIIVTSTKRTFSEVHFSWSQYYASTPEDDACPGDGEQLLDARGSSQDTEDVTLQVSPGLLSGTLTATIPVEECTGRWCPDTPFMVSVNLVWTCSGPVIATKHGQFRYGQATGTVETEGENLTPAASDPTETNLSRKVLR